MRAMGELFTAEERTEFLRLARIQVKRETFFRHMGRHPDTGLDCAGLPQWLVIQMGRKPWDIEAYGTSPHSNDLRDAMVRNLGNPIWKRGRAKKIPDGILQPAQLVLMRFETEPKHVAIVGDYPGAFSLIHTYGVIKKVTEHRLDPFWESKILEVFQL